jgi:hypothetical protein
VPSDAFSSTKRGCSCDVCAFAALGVASGGHAISKAESSFMQVFVWNCVGNIFSYGEAPEGCLAWSYTSRIALITVSGSSNWMYSELLWANVCLEFEDNSSQRA